MKISEKDGRMRIWNSRSSYWLGPTKTYFVKKVAAYVEQHKNVSFEQLQRSLIGQRLQRNYRILMADDCIHILHIAGLINHTQNNGYRRIIWKGQRTRK